MENTVLDAEVCFSDPSSKRYIYEFKEMRIDLSQVSANSRRILVAMDIEKRMEELQSISKQIILKRRLPQGTEKVNPGDVYIFEVNVECGSEGLIVIEKVGILFRKELISYNGKSYKCSFYAITFQLRILLKPCEYHAKR